MTANPIVIEVRGNPVAKGRPRATKTGRLYTPGKTRDWESLARVLAQAAMKHGEPIAGPVEVTVRAVFPIPASWPAWKRVAAADGQVAHTAKPDGDNVLKAAKDALNGVVYRDDAQVVDVYMRKTYGTVPRVIITVTPLPLIPSQQTRRPAA